MFTTITSVQNPRAKEAVKLRNRRGREKQGRFVIDGFREVQRAAQAHVPIVEVFLCAQSAADEVRTFAKSLAGGAAQVFLLTPPVFGKLAYGDRNEGIIAVARTPQSSLEHLRLTGAGPVVVLEAVEKPGNVGAVLRTADAAGAAAVIVADGATDLYNPNAIRASLGAIFSVPVCEARSADALIWLRRNQRPIYAARVGVDVPYTEVSMAQPCAIALGSEANGLSEIWRGEDIIDVSLPMLGLVDSLNVSTTAAVLLYEALRQRQA